MGLAVLDRARRRPLDGIDARKEGRHCEGRSQAQAVMSPVSEVRLGASRELTLDDLITGAWEGLVVCRTACCPACGGEMASRLGAEGGACGCCGARLS
jgi:hypothetical protein